MSTPNERPELPDTWAAAVNEADFVLCEIVVPAPTHQWAGGYGSSHEGVVVMEILAVVEGAEVSVETHRSGEAPPPDLRRSFLLRDLVQAVFALDNPAFELPQTLTLDEEDRTISVDGEPYLFRGYSANGRAWLGAATLSDRREVVLRDPMGARPTALAARKNCALPDRRPSHH